MIKVKNTEILAKISFYFTFTSLHTGFWLNLYENMGERESAESVQSQSCKKKLRSICGACQYLRVSVSECVFLKEIN